MAKQHTVTSYEFDELSSKAKEVARDWFREGALDYEWWDSVYEDAKNVGLKITEFDTGRHFIGAELTVNPIDSAQAVVADHGKDTATYKIASSFLKSVKNPDDRGVWDRTAPREVIEEMGEEYLSNLKDAYLQTLIDEAEYLTSDEQVDESIRANEYEFHKNGKRFVL